MDTIELKIKGMSCGSCVSSVTHALQRVSGNAQAAPAMLAALAAAGYEAESLSTGAGAKTEHAHHGDVPTGTAHKSGGCCH